MKTSHTSELNDDDDDEEKENKQIFINCAKMHVSRHYLPKNK